MHSDSPTILKQQKITCCFEGKFEYGVAEGIVDPGLNPISAFRLSVIQNSEPK